PWTATLMWIATLAIAGIPPLSGFFSKDEILGAAFALATAQPIWYVYWLMGVATALLTAFYMTRLMLYTFHGPNRTGDKEREHLHEAPWVMTGPLMVLGLLTLVGGALNLPELVGGGAFLHHWLEPVTALADRMRPAVELSRIVDGLLVNGSATASRALGWIGSRLQTGEVGFYVVLFVVGVLLVVGGAVR